MENSELLIWIGKYENRYFLAAKNLKFYHRIVINVCYVVLLTTNCRLICSCS